MGFTVIIPARYASTRLPGKPLLDIAGKPMIQHVYERANESGATKVIIATDDERVVSAASHFGAEVCLTSVEHHSGTERLSEVVEKFALEKDEVVVNLQGDEPLISPRLIRQVANSLDEHPQASVATLCERINNATELFDPNAVKVITDEAGYAIYFSRAPIPWHRDAFAVAKDQLPEGCHYFRHIGLYAYRAAFIQDYISWPACELEKIESLEQLRVLWRGKKIYVSEASETTMPGVDTESDLTRARQLLEKTI